MKRIIFILSNIYDPHALKRIEEFKAHGYTTEAYGFSRRKNVKSESVKEIGYLGDKTYFKRFPIIYKGIKSVLMSFNDTDSVLYLFGLDVAMIVNVICGKKNFIYEECDLAHTYINNKLIRANLEYIDRLLVKRSLITIFTSEGFAIFHFGKRWPENVMIITNRLDPVVLNYHIEKKKQFDKEHINIGFVGMIRFNSIYSFSSYFLKKYPQHDFHFFGRIDANLTDKYKSLETYSNCHFHGAFKSPIDLPDIYSKIDLVLSTYDVECENVRYAEPNKLYESLYFETPIIVSKGTYLEKRVKDLGSGYSVDPMSPNSIDCFMDQLTINDYKEKIISISKIPKEYAINTNEELFNRLSKLL